MKHYMPKTKLGATAKERLALFSVLTQTSLTPVTDYVKLVDHLVTHKGEREAIAVLKRYQLWVRNKTLGITQDNIPFHRADKTGFPKILNPWKKWLKSADNSDNKQFINTIFGVVKSLRLPPKIETETITSPSSAEPEMVQEFVNYCKNWKGVPKDISLIQDETLPLRSTKGPNGYSSSTSLNDLLGLVFNTPKLMQAVFTLLGYSNPGAQDLFQFWALNMQVDKSACDKFTKRETSRLRFLSDKAGKTRVVALADYWSQTSLLPLHKFFMNFLKGRKTDCTYRQGHLANILKLKTKHKVFVGTADMTAFTDRFPKEPQVAIVSRVFGEKISQTWLEVMVNRSFKVDNSNEFVTYACGQPMGLYSSWPICVTTLHALIEYSAEQTGKQGFDKYLILGDDVAIFDRKVYTQFIKNVEKLGITVNRDKSTYGEGFAEMAKRFFVLGEEVTGYPLEILKVVRNDPIQIIEVLNNLNYLDFKPVPVSRLLALVPKRFHTKVLGILTSPALFGIKTGQISWNGSIDLKLEEWNWPQESIARAYKKAVYEKFMREVLKLQEERSVTEHSGNPPAVAISAALGCSERDPLVYALSGHYMGIQDIMDKLNHSITIEAMPNESELYSLVFPRESKVYTHAKLPRKKAHFKGHLILDALSLLKQGDFSQGTEPNLDLICQIQFDLLTISD
jgi:hypothetical protein